MPDTTFIPFTTSISSAWCQTINNVAYRALGFTDAGPFTPVQALSNIGGVPLTTYNAFLASLAASGGSSLVGYTQGSGAATARTAQDKMRDVVSAFDFMTSAQITDVRAGTHSVDVTAALQAAVDYAASLNIPLVLPGGVYSVLPATPQAGAATYNTALVLRGNLHIIGQSGATLRVADNYSTDASPKELAIFSTVSHLANITFEGVVFDLNGANNHMSPSRPTTYNQFNHAAILVNGPTGYLDNVRIQNCLFQNTAGVCFIVCQLVAVGTTPPLGHTWKILDCFFYNGGLDTNDHTSVYAWCEDVVCSGCTFWEDSPPHTVGKTGGATCYEIHGSYQRVTGNYFYNYTLGAYVSPNFTNMTISTIVAGNTFYCSDYGILLWNAVALGYKTIVDVLITGNIFYFDSYTYAGQPTYKAAVAYQGLIATVQGPINDVRIQGNVARSVSTTLQVQFLHFDASATAGNTCDKWIVVDNLTQGMTDSVTVLTNASTGLGLMEISRNQFTDGTPDALANPPHGIFVNAAGLGIQTLIINDNAFVDGRGVPQMNTAIHFAGGTINTMSLGNQTFRGMTAANVNNAGGATTFTNMVGSAMDTATATISDGGSITFNGSFTNIKPRQIVANGSVAGDILTVTQPYVANSCTVAIKKWTGGVLTAGSNQTVTLLVKF